MKPGYMAWKSVGAHGATDKNYKEVFARGDVILRDDRDQLLQQIWAGILEVTFDPIVAPVLVLVRDNLNEDADDHIVLVRLDPCRVNDDLEIYCRLFAAGYRTKRSLQTYFLHLIPIGQQICSRYCETFQ